MHNKDCPRCIGGLTVAFFCLCIIFLLVLDDEPGIATQVIVLNCFSTPFLEDTSLVGFQRTVQS
jgi:hypothetical protein